jgi:hypothetical protein
VPTPHFTPFEGRPGESGKYATIDIETTETVTGCCGHIRKITTQGMEIPVRAPIPLRWIAHKPLKRDLVPGLTYGMTVVFAESTSTEFFISTDTREPRGIPWALNPGVSIVEVVISADSAPNLELNLRVDATNTWNLLDMKLLEDYEAERASIWATEHPVSASLGLKAGGTAPYDDERERRLQEALNRQG